MDAELDVEAKARNFALEANRQREGAAIRFAHAAHKDQKYGHDPYWIHLAHVRLILDEYGQEGDLCIAAWLHDVVEDTPIDPQKIGVLLKDFGPKVSDLVWAVTGLGRTRKQRTACVYKKLRCSPEACVLKLADRIANVEACVENQDVVDGIRCSAAKKLEMYRAEHADFTKAILAGVPFEHPLHYHPVSAMLARLDALFSKTQGEPT